jgi:hypothetical protein
MRSIKEKGYTGLNARVAFGLKDHAQKRFQAIDWAG